MSDLPETMFRTRDFDDSDVEPLKQTTSMLIDETADDEWYASDSVPAWVRPDGVCPAFQWIGQPLTSCDSCGQPYWDHTHEAKPDGGGPFSVRERHVVIPQPVRQRARATWDRGI